MNEDNTEDEDDDISVEDELVHFDDYVSSSNEGERLNEPEYSQAALIDRVSKRDELATKL